MQAVRWPPLQTRRDRRRPDHRENDHRQKGNSQQSYMQPSLLARAETLRNVMRIGVAGQQEYLKDQHVGRPNGGRATEPWQHVFADDELDLKKEKGAEKQSRSENPNDAIGF